jgi:site-specific recombinase XerD
MTALVLLPDAPVSLIPPDADKDGRHRLGLFSRWLNGAGRSWREPDLAVYRDHLLYERRLAPSSVSAHLATVRARYAALLRDNAVRDALYALTPAEASPAERKAFVDETLERLRNAADPRNAPVTVITSQDRPDASHIRLTVRQANTLLEQPGVDTLMGLRDTALIALMLCTGLREGELCALDVPNLRQRLGGALALHVRRGKGAKERLIPYGALDWCLAVVEAWLTEAGIKDEAVFRSFWKGGRPRDSRLTARAVQNVLKDYPLMIDGQLTQ